MKIVKSATGITYEFTYDAYGNNTSVSVAGGGNIITSRAVYTADNVARMKNGKAPIGYKSFLPYSL